MIGGADGREFNLLVYYVLYSGETVPPSRPSMSEVRGCTLLPDYTVSCVRRLSYVLIFFQYIELIKNFHRRAVTLVLSNAVDNHIWNIPHIWSLFFLTIVICYFLSACLLY